MRHLRQNVMIGPEPLNWLRVDVLHQRILSLYMLILVISFCIYTEEITGNLLILLQLLIEKVLFTHGLVIYL